MVTRHNPKSGSSPRRVRRPASSPEARENQLISAAIDLVERQIAEGTASSQVLSHYLKLGSTRESLEQERLQRENELLRAKVAAMAANERLESVYLDALNAMRRYSGQEVEEEFDE